MNSTECSLHAVHVMKSISLWWSQLKEVKNWDYDFNYFLMYLCFLPGRKSKQELLAGFPRVVLGIRSLEWMNRIVSGKRTNLRNERVKSFDPDGYHFITNKPKTLRQNNNHSILLSGSGILAGLKWVILLLHTLSLDGVQWQLVWSGGSRWLSLT